MCAAVVAHGDAAPVLEAIEHVFDFMALLVESFIIFDKVFAVAARRNARLCTSGPECRPEPVAVISPVGQHLFGGWQPVGQDGGTFIIAGLPFSQNHGGRLTVAVTDRRQFGVQAALRATDTAG